MKQPNIVVDLVRHAESAMNVAMADATREPFIGGRQNEIDLSPDGENQARALGKFALDNGIRPTLLFHSPATRSRRTCELSAEAMGLTTPMHEDDLLQELDQGHWTNGPRSLYDEPDIMMTMAHYGSDFAPPGGESMNDVADRMDEFFASLLRTTLTDEPQHVWAHTHGVAIKAWWGRLCGWPHEQTYKTAIGNVSLSRVVLEDGLWQPVLINRQTIPTK